SNLSNSLHFCLMPPRQPTSTLFPYTTLFRSESASPEIRQMISDSPSASTARLAPRTDICLTRQNTYLVPDLCVVPRRGSHRSSRSEEHTSELQSRSDLVCRLLLEKKKKNKIN